MGVKGGVKEGVISLSLVGVNSLCSWPIVLGSCGIVQRLRFTSSPLAGLTSIFTSTFTSGFSTSFFKDFVNIFSCLSGMPSVSHEGPSAQPGEVRQAFGPTLSHFPPSFGSAKVRQ